MFSPVTSYCKLFSKRKQSSLNNKIFFYTRCTAFGITDCKTVKGSSYCCNYVTVSRLCDREITKYYFQPINYKYKRIKTEILKTREKYL